MSNQTFTFTREQLAQLLEGTINLYIEYVDKYETEDALAVIRATSETMYGIETMYEISVTDEELNDIGRDEMTV